MSAWYLGVDPASRTVGLAAIDESGKLRHREILGGAADLPQRLVALRTQGAEFVRELEGEGVWSVVVERPAMRFPTTTVIAAYGVLLEASAANTRAVVIELSPSQIDETLGLKGGQRKPRCMEYARSIGYAGDSQDIADALVAAAAGRVLAQKAVAA